MTAQPSSARRPTTNILIGCAALLILLCCAAVVGGIAYFALRRGSIVQAQPAVEYILDASPRMQQPSEGGTRLTVARGVLAEIIRPSDPQLTAGLRVFGTGALPVACSDTDLLVPLAPASQGEISDSLLGLDAGNSSEAAMVEAMIAAIRDLSSAGGPHTLVVVTGGYDSCNPEASQLVTQEAERAGITLETYVVGYQVSDEDAAAIKGFIEDIPGGEFRSAEDSEALRSVLSDIQQRAERPSMLSFLPQGLLPTRAPSDAGGGEAATQAPTPEAGGYASQTACDHPYFPIRQGASWTYSSDVGAQTWSVTSVSGDLNSASATMEMSFPGGTITYTWECSSSGVVSFDFGTMGLNAAPGVGEITITSSSGTILPPPDQLVPGVSWSNTFTEEVHTGAAGVDFTMTMDASESYTATGFETISTGAGSFEALRIDGSGTFTTSSEMVGTYSTTAQFTYWLAPGVGFVRFETSAEGVSSVSELTGYSIP
jgi:hypothetical protein